MSSNSIRFSQHRYLKEKLYRVERDMVVVHVQCLFLICFTSLTMLFPVYLWRYTDLQAIGRRFNLLSDSLAIDRKGSLTCLVKHGHWITFLQYFQETWLLCFVVVSSYDLMLTTHTLKYTAVFYLCIGHVWKQHTLQVNGHAWFHLHELRRAVRNEKEAKIKNKKYCCRTTVITTKPQMQLHVF